MVLDRHVEARRNRPRVEGAVGRRGYHDGLRMVQQRLVWAPLVGYLSVAVTGTVEGLFATREALQKLADNWRVRRKFGGRLCFDPRAGSPRRSRNIGRTHGLPP